jgi:peroxiredoxin
MQSAKTDRILKISIAALLAAMVFVIYDSLREKVVTVGDSAPEFRITADNGKAVSLSGFGGKLLVLNFWATWCPPCVEEMPSLDRFSRELAGSGVVVLGISVDKDANAYRAFLGRNKVSFLTARDPETRINADFGTFKYPETYVIDTRGKVLRKFIGPENWDDERMKSDIKSLL